MKVTHNSRTGRTTISLNWNETKQFISSAAASTAVQDLTSKLVTETSFAGKTTKSITN